MLRTCAIFLFVSAAALQASAQSISSADTAQIIDLTVRAMHGQHGIRIFGRPDVEIKFDPTSYRSGAYSPSTDSSLRHSEQTVARIRAFSGAVVVTPARARECITNPPADCMREGISVVVRLSTPVIRGDSGYVDAFIHTARQPTAEDSLRQAGGRGQTRATGARTTGARSVRASLAKTASGWIVTGVVTRGVS